MYGDEEIIKKRVAAGDAKLHNINSTVKIDGVDYSFNRREFDFGISMIVPEAFEEIPEQIAQMKFPSVYRPKTILANEGCRVCLAFNDIEPLSEAIDIEVLEFRSYIKKIRPANVFFTHGIYDLPSGMRIGHYDYSYPVANGDLYNITFLTNLADMGLLGGFICPAEAKDKWEPLVRQMIQSIELIEVKNNVW